MKLLIAFALLLPLYAQSQPPSPTSPIVRQDNKSEAGGKKAETYNDHNGADKIAAAIDKLASEIASWKKKSDADPGNSYSSSEWITAIATFAIALLALFQWLTMRQHKHALDAMAAHMASGLEKTTTAANAAKDSANTAKNTFVSSHRPRLAMRFISAKGIEQINPASGTFYVFNTGGTNAHLTHAYSELVAYPPEQLRLPASIFEGKVAEALTEVELPPGGYTILSFPTAGPTKQPEAYRDFDVQRHGHLYLIGWIEYTDAAQRLHRMGFARQYDRIGRRFNREPDEDYEYDD
jgi:hypothetical protein